MEKDKEEFLCHKIGKKADLEYIFEYAFCESGSYPCSKCPHRVACEFRTKKK